MSGSLIVVFLSLKILDSKLQTWILLVGTPTLIKGVPYLCMQEWVTNIVKNIKFLAANESVQPRGSAFFCFSNGPWLQNNVPPYSVFFFFWFATAFCLLFHERKKLEFFLLA